MALAIVEKVYTVEITRRRCPRGVRAELIDGQICFIGDTTEASVIIAISGMLFAYFRNWRNKGKCAYPAPFPYI